MDVADPRDLQREVTVLVEDVLLRPRDPLREPAAVRDRDELILGAVPHLDRDFDLVELESPRLDEDEVVLDPAVDAAPQRLGDLLVEVPRKVTGEAGEVGRAEERGERLGDRLR